MKILLQTVGTGGGDAHPVWEALKFTVDATKPDLLVQICSEKTFHETVPKFKLLFDSGETLPETEYLILESYDDFECIRSQIKEKLNELISQHAEASIEGDYTSGTKAMSSAIMSTLLECGATQLHCGVGERDETGRATSTEKLVSFSTADIFAERMLPEFGRMFNKQQFTAVRQQSKVFADQVQNKELTQSLTALRSISCCCEHWNRFDYKQAHNAFRNGVRRNIEVLKATGWDKNQLDKNNEHLSKCKEQLFSISRCVDLLLNAERCITRGYYDDAISRLYRLVELVVQVRFFTYRNDVPTSQNPTKNIPISWLNEHTPHLAKKKSHSTQFNKISLASNDAVDALKELGDGLGSFIENQWWKDKKLKEKGPLGKLLERRNDSYLAHGSVTVPKEVADNMFLLVNDIVIKLAEVQNVDFLSIREGATMPIFPSKLLRSLK